MNDFFPANLVHPGEILEEELKSRGIRHKDFAASIGMQPTHFSAIISGSKNITKQTARVTGDTCGSVDDPAAEVHVEYESITVKYIKTCIRISS